MKNNKENVFKTNITLLRYSIPQDGNESKSTNSSAPSSTKKACSIKSSSCSPILKPTLLISFEWVQSTGRLMQYRRTHASKFYLMFNVAKLNQNKDNNMRVKSQKLRISPRLALII